MPINEIDDEDLHQQRGATDELHIGHGQVAQGRIGERRASPARVPSRMAKMPATRESLTVTQTPQAMGPAVQLSCTSRVSPRKTVSPFSQLGALGSDGLTAAGVEIVLQEELSLVRDHGAVKLGIVFLFCLIGDVLGNAFPAPGVIHCLHGLVDAENGGQHQQQEDPVPEQLIGLFFHLSCEFGVDHCHNLFCRYRVGSSA